MIFISYSHADQAVARRLAEKLEGRGEQVFIDHWDIQAGDSIVQKIFEYGIGNATAFLILVSDNSVASSWVREELDQATVRRIEGVTRVIPVRLDDSVMPVPLRTLKWVDIRGREDEAVEEIINAVHGVGRRPDRGAAPQRIVALPESVGGLSRGATALGALILRNMDPDTGDRYYFEGPELVAELGFEPRPVNDAVDELEEVGVVKTQETLGSAPFSFFRVIPTYMLFFYFRDSLAYNPEDDVQRVLAAVASLEKTKGEELQHAAQLSVGRLNRAVEYIKDYDLANVIQYFGTAPFVFGDVWATRRTRQAVE